MFPHAFSIDDFGEAGIAIVECGIAVGDGECAVHVKRLAMQCAAVERAALNGAVGVAFHTLGRYRGLLAGDHDIQLATFEQEGLCHADALGIVAGALDVECAARHRHVIVGLHASATGAVPHFVNSCGTAGDDGRATAGDINQAVAVDTLGAIGSNLHGDPRCRC